MDSSQFQLLDGQVYAGGQQAQERPDAASADSLDAFQRSAPGMARAPRKGWLRARQLDHIVTHLERLQIVKRSRVQTRIRSGDGGSGRDSTTNANA